MASYGQRAAGYARHLRQAEVNFAHAEAPRLLAVVREVAALHQPVQDGLGYLGDGSYGTISPACSTCGTHDEYAVPWPCPTARAVQALTETTARRAFLD